MKPSNILSLLGIAQKARKLVSGYDSLVRAIMSDKVFLIILAVDAGKNTKEKVKFLAESRNIPIYCWANSDELSRSIGKEGRKVIGIVDKGFAQKIISGIKLLTGVGNIDENSSV